MIRNGSKRTISASDELCIWPNFDGLSFLWCRDLSHWHLGKQICFLNPLISRYKFLLQTLLTYDESLNTQQTGVCSKCPII